MNILHYLQQERDRLAALLNAIDKALAALMPVFGQKEEQPAKQPAPPKEPPVRSEWSSATRAAAPRQPQPRPEKPAADGDELTYAQAAKIFPYTAGSISQLKVNKRITGGRGTIHRSSMEKYIRSINGEKKKAPPSGPRKKPDRGYKIKPTIDARRPWLNGKSKAEDMKPHEWIADKLKITESEVHAIIKAGRIHGGDHVANWEQLQAYMAHPSYQTPEPVEA